SGHSLPSMCRRCLIAPIGPHPLNMFAARILSKGWLPEQATFELVVKNIGTLAWTDDQFVEVRTNGRARSAHYHPSWPEESIACRLMQTPVYHGKTARLRFHALAGSPEEPETFQLFLRTSLHGLSEGVWLPSTQFTLAPSPELGCRTPEYG